METKIPPDIVLLICGALMWLAARYLPQFGVTISYHVILFVIFLLAGTVIAWSGKMALSRHRTTERPDSRSLSQAKVLVTGGAYQYTRNPVYAGMTIVLIGWAVFLMNGLAAAGVLVFIGFMTRFQILPEEKALEIRFGSEFIRYKKRVRRWV